MYRSHPHLSICAVLHVECGFIVVVLGLVSMAPQCFLQLSSASIVDCCLRWHLGVTGLVSSSQLTHVERPPLLQQHWAALVSMHHGILRIFQT